MVARLELLVGGDFRVGGNGTGLIGSWIIDPYVYDICVIIIYDRRRYTIPR